MMIRTAGLICGLLLASGALAADLVPDPAAIKYGPVPTAFPAGATIAVLSGNPFAAGDYVLRLKMPDGYVIPAHHHPTTENVTVVSGVFYAGMGDRLDKAAAAPFVPGGFAALPAGMNHFAWAKGDTIVQVHGKGPFEITYVDPKDDPRNK
nr:cupin domain-containing protein [Polymorphobacter sp.]